MDIFLEKRLKEPRTENELTQKQVAEALGINTVTYLHHEKAQRTAAVAARRHGKIFRRKRRLLLGLTDY